MDLIIILKINLGKSFDFSVAQIINESENKKDARKSSLNEKLSDLVGSSSYEFNKNFKVSHNFAVDQSYSELNYNELGANYTFKNLNLDFNYLKEQKHIGDQDYFKTEINFQTKDSGILSFETKRNLITDSADFYNLSYEYINDCLRAGLVYRREFYNDSEIEPDDSLMFKITLVPFGNLNSPKFEKMRVNFFIVLFLFNFFLYNGLYAEINNKIIVKVGNKIITSLDIQNKILSSLILTGNNVNQENINKLKKSLIDLVNIRLKENEVEETENKIDQSRINDYLNKISSNNLENLKIKFTKFNIDFKLFVEEIETELKWQKYIYEKYSKKIKLTKIYY